MALLKKPSFMLSPEEQPAVAPPSQRSGAFARIAESEAEQKKSMIPGWMKSAATSMQDLTTGAAKTALSSAVGLGQFGSRIMGSALEKTTGIKPMGNDASVTRFREETLKLEGLMQNVGAVGADIAMAVAPGMAVSKLGKAEGAAKLAARVGGEAAGALGFAAAKKPNITGKEALTAAAVGAAFPIAGAALSKAGKVAGHAAKFMASKMSGVPKEAIEEALRNPVPVRRAIREMAKNPEMGPRKILDGAEEALQALKTARGDAYKSALAKIKMDKTPVVENAEKIKDVARNAFQEFKIGLSDADEVVSTVKTVMPKANVRDLSEVYERVKAWDDFTPIGMDDLKQVMRSYEKSGITLSTGDKQFNAVLNKINDNVVKLLPSNVREMSQKYASQSEIIDDIRKGLSLDKGADVTAMRKLTNLFNPRSEVYRDLVEKLGDKVANDLRADIAGLLMSRATAEGLGGYLSSMLMGAGSLASSITPAAVPGAIVGALGSSPRLVGEAATGLGKLAQQGGLKAVKEITKGAIKRSLLNGE